MDKQPFIEIINHHKGIIKSLCHLYYNREEDRKDAFQDIVLELWKSIDTFRGSAAMSTWIYRVGLNTLINKMRKEKRKVEVEIIDTPHHHITNANADDHLELLTSIIQSLKEIDKAIVILYLEGYQNKEIAEILKLTPTNVSTRFNRLKAQLKLKYKSDSHATKRP